MGRTFFTDADFPPSRRGIYRGAAEGRAFAAWASRTANEALARLRGGMTAAELVGWIAAERRAEARPHKIKARFGTRCHLLKRW